MNDKEINSEKNFFSNDWNNNPFLSTEKFRLDENDKILDNHFDDSRIKQKVSSNKSLSSKFILALFLIIIGFFIIYSSSFIFDYLGLSPSTSIPNKDFSSEINSGKLQAEALHIKVPPMPEPFKNELSKLEDIKIPEKTKMEQEKLQTLGLIEIKNPNVENVDNSKLGLTEIKIPNVESTPAPINEKKSNEVSINDTAKKTQDKISEHSEAVASTDLIINSNEEKQNNEKFNNKEKHNTEKLSAIKNEPQYILQILGLHNQKNAKSFIEKNALKNELKLYQTTRNGKQWFIVTYGEYDSANKAKSALNNLPIELKKHKPWIRKYDHLQEVATLNTNNSKIQETVSDKSSNY